MEKELAELVSSTLQSELITISIVIILVILFKDFASNLASGISFKLNKEFNEGDRVILDGKPAIIVSIGIRQTKFQLQEDDKIVWRFVYNTRIPTLNLCKVVGRVMEEKEEN